MTGLRGVPMLTVTVAGVREEVTEAGGRGNESPVGADMRAERRTPSAWRNAPGQRKDRNLDEVRPTVSARSPPSVPGTKYLCVVRESATEGRNGRSKCSRQKTK